MQKMEEIDLVILIPLGRACFSKERFDPESLGSWGTSFVAETLKLRFSGIRDQKEDNYAKA